MSGKPAKKRAPLAGAAAAAAGAQPERERIAEYGTPREADYVRVFRERKLGKIRLQFTHPQSGRLKTQSFPDDAAGLKRARQVAETLTVRLRGHEDVGSAKRYTTTQLGEFFEKVKREKWRPNTARNFAQQWAAALDFLGANTRADRVRIPDLDALRAHYRAKGWEHSTVREVIATVKRVWKWSEGRGYLVKNWLYAYVYEIAKEEQSEGPDEYSREEFVKLRAVLSPTRADQWRAWVMLTVCGRQGARQHAVRHLQWADVDFAGGEIIWRAAYDKNGKEWRQPIRPETREALGVAEAWREAKGYEGPWVLFGGHARNKGETYTLGAFHSALRNAEDRAGVTHKPRRAGHAMRRMVAGDVAEQTQDGMLALQAIGDKDPRMAARYLKKRDHRVAKAFRDLDADHQPAAPVEVKYRHRKPATKRQPPTSEES